MICPECPRRASACPGDLRPGADPGEAGQRNLTPNFSKRPAEHVLCGRVGWGLSADVLGREGISQKRREGFLSCLSTPRAGAPAKRALRLADAPLPAADDGGAIIYTDTSYSRGGSLLLRSLSARDVLRFKFLSTDLIGIHGDDSQSALGRETRYRVLLTGLGRRIVTLVKAMQ